MDKELFDPEFFRKLESLSFFLRRKVSHSQTGEHISQRKGLSLEFSDYRRYNPGDDYRYVDWNIYGRLDKLFLKIFHAEENLTLHILLDISYSMSIGNPSKHTYAKKLAAALGYLALSHLDQVKIVAFSETINQTLSLRGGPHYALKLFEFLASLSCGGKTQFNQCLEEYARSARKSGQAIIVSDLLDPVGFEKGLSALYHQKFDLVLIHLLHKEELQPSLWGDLKLIDLETQEVKKISINRDLLNGYQRKMSQFLQGVKYYCLRYQIDYYRADTCVPFEDLILKYLRQGLY